MDLNKIYNEDCISENINEGMNRLEDKSIDMILCDLPFGVTKCNWDTIIQFDKLWEQYNRIIKNNGAIVLFGSEPFSSLLRCSNLKEYKYDWYWKKSKANGFFNVKKMPLKDIETISIFYKNLPVYNPQGIKIYNKVVKNPKGKMDNSNHISGHNGGVIKEENYIREFTNYPRQILDFSTVARPIHPTQKPTELFEYLIKTYTNEGDTILDNCMGSGTTAIASINTNRNYIGFEMDENYYNLANERIEKHLETLKNNI